MGDQPHASLVSALGGCKRTLGGGAVTKRQEVDTSFQLQRPLGSTGYRPGTWVTPQFRNIGNTLNLHSRTRKNEAWDALEGECRHGGAARFTRDAWGESPEGAFRRTLVASRPKAAAHFASVRAANVLCSAERLS